MELLQAGDSNFMSSTFNIPRRTRVTAYDLSVTSFFNVFLVAAAAADDDTLRVRNSFTTIRDETAFHVSLIAPNA